MHTLYRLLLLWCLSAACAPAWAQFEGPPFAPPDDFGPPRGFSAGGGPPGCDGQGPPPFGRGGRIPQFGGQGPPQRLSRQGPPPGPPPGFGQQGPPPGPPPDFDQYIGGYGYRSQATSHGSKHALSNGRFPGLWMREEPMPGPATAAAPANTRVPPSATCKCCCCSGGSGAAKKIVHSLRARPARASSSRS